MVGKAYKNVFAHLVISVLLKKNSTDRPTDRPTNKGTDRPTDQPTNRHLGVQKLLCRSLKNNLCIILHYHCLHYLYNSTLSSFEIDLHLNFCQFEILYNPKISDQKVSRTHFSMYLENGILMLSNNSQNGTYINGFAVEKQVIFPGDIISMK